MSYLIKKSDKTNSIIVFDYEMDGYTFKPKIGNGDYLSVNKVVVINPTLIDKILTIKFNELFKRILNRAYFVLENDDASSSDVVIILDEVEKLKAIVEHKYQRFLSKEKEKIFLKKISLLEDELKSKMWIANYSYNETYEDKKGRSR